MYFIMFILSSQFMEVHKYINKRFHVYFYLLTATL